MATGLGRESRVWRWLLTALLIGLAAGCSSDASTTTLGALTLKLDGVIVRPGTPGKTFAPLERPEILVRQPPTPWEPERGTDWVYVHLLVSGPSQTPIETVGQAVAITEAGDRYVSAVEMRQLSPRSKFYSFPFAVPRGERPALLELGGAVLDLQSVPWDSEPPSGQ